MNRNKGYRERIVMNSKIHFGKPCISGTRVPVENILELIQEGIAFEEIVTSYYPDLEIEDVKDCARYATDIIKHEEVHIGAV